MKSTQVNHMLVIAKSLPKVRVSLSRAAFAELIPPP